MIRIYQEMGIKKFTAWVAVVWVCLYAVSVFFPHVVGLPGTHHARWDGVQSLTFDGLMWVRSWGRLALGAVAVHGLWSFSDSTDEVSLSTVLPVAMVVTGVFGMAWTLTDNTLLNLILSALGLTVTVFSIIYVGVYLLNSEAIASLSEPLWALAIKMMIIGVVSLVISGILGVLSRMALAVFCPSSMEPQSVCAGPDTLSALVFWLGVPTIFIIGWLFGKEKLPSPSSSGSTASGG